GPQAVPAWSRGRAPGPALPRSGAADAAEAVRLARQGAQGQDQAASLLLRQWGARLMRYFMRHGRCSEAVAEELTADAILQFVLGLPPEHVPAEVWLWTLSRHLLIDWARAQASRKRGGADMAWSGRAEITLDDDSMLALLERQAPAHHEDLPAWVRDCVHKAAALMEREEPRHAMVLWMVAQGWSAEEIAIHFGAPPEGVTERQRAAARDRVYRACQTARAHFDHCRE
ncbi:MAG: hypothetical protein RL722_2501, partial [Pseudomonadota bacterium]